MAEKKKKKLIGKLKNRYRLVVMNASTYQEKASVTLTPMNVFIALSTAFVIFGLLIVSIILFTPIKEYIPGYARPEMAEKINTIGIATDTLEESLRLKNQYAENVLNILKGGDGLTDTSNISTEDGHTSHIDPNEHSRRDSVLREQFENEDEFSIKATDAGQKIDKGLYDYVFFPPLKGTITEGYDPSINHPAVDVVAGENEAVKATLDGMVIIATWTPETGHVMAIQHENNLISVYKHNSVLLKKIGTFVKAGDAIAVVGNSGELTTGPHLHFELWYNGKAINPADFISF